MADSRNLVLQLLITARDQASAVLRRTFAALNDATNVLANQVRAAFSDLFGGGLQSAADFEKTLNAVAAKGGYTRDEMSRLAAAADDLGAQFGTAGGDVAKGMEVLAAAGLNARDIVATLPSVLAMAKVEGISLDQAATKLADSLSIMGLKFEHAGRMADVLAQGANITLSSSVQLADALVIAGGAATQYGLSLEQTVAALDLLHKNGIKGAEAGTALRNIFLQLIDPTSQASQAVASLGGDTRDLNSVLATLAPQTNRTRDAMIAFGSESYAALAALRKEGARGLGEFTGQLNNAAGAALAASEKMGGGLVGAMGALAGAWDALKRKLLTPLLEPLAQQASTLAAQFNDPALQNGAQKLGTVLSAGLKASVEWAKRLATEGAAYLASFVGEFSFSGVVQKVSDAKDNIVRLMISGLELIQAGLTRTAAGMVQTTAQLVADIKTGLIGLLDAIRQLPLIQGAAFDRITQSIRSLKQGLPEISNLAKLAGEQGAKAQDDYNRALEQSILAYQDLKAGVGEYERSVREGAARMGISEQAYIAYLNQHGVELQKLIPIELERLQTTTKTQEELLKKANQNNEANQQAVDIAKILKAAGEDELEIQRLQALAAGDLTTALAIEAQQRERLSEVTRQQTEEVKHLTDAQLWNQNVTEGMANTLKRWADEGQAAGDLFSGVLSQWAQRMNELSPAARQAFDGFTEGARTANDVTREMVVAMENLATGGFVEWANRVALKALAIEQAFNAQAEAADQLTAQLDQVAEGGGQAAGGLDLLVAQAESARNNLNLLDQQRLDALTQAIDRATQRMQDFRQSSEDALQAAQEALLQEQGDQEALLKLEYQRKQLELQQKINEARQLGDQEALRNLQQAMELEEKTYQLKLKKIEAEKQAANPSPGSSGGGGSTSGGGGASGGQGTTGSNVAGGGHTTGGSGLPAGGQGLPPIIVNAPNAGILDQKFADQLARVLQPALADMARRRR